MTERDTTGPTGDPDYAAMAEESRRARDLDSGLAESLRQLAPRGATSSAAYLRGLGDRPSLSETREHELVVAAQNGDQQARDRLIEANLPLVARMASLYRGSPGVSRIELTQEGVVGLLRALERYDPDQAVPFAGYASFWVRQAMQRLVAELTRPLVLSDRTLRQLAQVRRARDQYLSRHGREPSAGQLARDTGMSDAHLQDLFAADGAARSWDEPLPGPDGDIGVLGDSVIDPASEDAYQELLDRSEIQQIQALLGSLSERERAILRARYGIGGPEQSLRDLGEDLGLSAERVRQIETRALGKLRASATENSPTGG